MPIYEGCEYDQVEIYTAMYRLVLPFSLGISALTLSPLPSRLLLPSILITCHTALVSLRAHTTVLKTPKQNTTALSATRTQHIHGMASTVVYMWTCCFCGNGGMNMQTTPSCLSCGNARCGNCHTEAHKTRA